jgi:glucokinase
MQHHREMISSREAQAPLFIGVDLGATNTKIGLVDDLGRTIGFQSIPTVVGAGPEAAAEEIERVVESVTGKAGVKTGDVVALGLAAPGPIDIPTGRLIAPVNLPGWHDFPLRDRVSHYCGLSVRFSHDACAAAYGEHWLGLGQNMHSLVLFTLGTGLGCGIVVDGVLIEGRHSHGAMAGHITVDVRDDARICPCGQSGHLEAYVSGIALVKRAVEVMESGGKTSLDARMEHGAPLTPLLIAEEAAAGDALCLEIVLEAARYLAVGIVAMMHTIDPDGVLIGGGINFGGPDSSLGRQFLDCVREEVRRRAFPIPAQQTTIDYATLGGDAGYLGAAGLARAEYHSGTKRSS